MNTPASTDRYKNHWFPAEIIRHGVWRYDRFCLRYRAGEEVLFVRGGTVTYEAIRQGGRKFGPQYANQLRRRPRPGDKGHLEEVFLPMQGERHSLGRAGDQEGNVLDLLVPRRRDKKAAKQFVRTLLKGLMYLPRGIGTDKLKSDRAARGIAKCRTPAASLCE